MGYKGSKTNVKTKDCLEQGRKILTAHSNKPLNCGLSTFWFPKLLEHSTWLHLDSYVIFGLIRESSIPPIKGETFVSVVVYSAVIVVSLCTPDSFYDIRKKINGLNKPGDLAVHTIVPPHPIHLLRRCYQGEHWLHNVAERRPIESRWCGLAFLVDLHLYWCTMLGTLLSRSRYLMLHLHL